MYSIRDVAQQLEEDGVPVEPDIDDFYFDRHDDTDEKFARVTIWMRRKETDD